MTTLREMPAEIRRIDDEIDDLDTNGDLNGDGPFSSIPAGPGTMFGELEKRLADCKLAFEEKVSGIASWLLDLDSEVVALDAEIKRLQKRKKTTENKIDGLKQYLLFTFAQLGIRKQKTPLVTLSVYPARLNVEVNLADVYAWPTAVYDRCITEEIKVNKNELKLCPGYQKLPGVKEVLGKPFLKVT